MSYSINLQCKILHIPLSFQVIHFSGCIFALFLQLPATRLAQDRLRVIEIESWNRGSPLRTNQPEPATMVLVLNGVLQDDCPMDTNSLFLQHPVYRDYAQQLHSIQAKSVGPVGLLYVGQRELAASAPHDKHVNIIGADDATTCIIVVVRHSGACHSQP